PAPQDGVDGIKKRTNAVVSSRMRAVEPIETAVEPGDEAVGASRNVDNYFSFLSHLLSSRCATAVRGTVQRNEPRRLSINDWVICCQRAASEYLEKSTGLGISAADNQAYALTEFGLIPARDKRRE